MGCYGIGVGRVLASIIEQNNDENGMILPMSIAPYQVALVQIDMKNEDQTNCAEFVYNELLAEGIEVLYDNRDERAGVKFKDMELIGIPLRVVVGKKIGEGLVELKYRKTGVIEEIGIKELIGKVKKIVKDGLK